jgi:hypothetical protein
MCVKVEMMRNWQGKHSPDWQTRTGIGAICQMKALLAMSFDCAFIRYQGSVRILGSDATPLFDNHAVS